MPPASRAPAANDTAKMVMFRSRGRLTPATPAARWLRHAFGATWLAAGLLGGLATAAQAQSQNQGQSQNQSSMSMGGSDDSLASQGSGAMGPIRLRQTGNGSTAADAANTANGEFQSGSQFLPRQPGYIPNEFERYVQQLAETDQAQNSGNASDSQDKLLPLQPPPLRRFGAELMTDAPGPGSSRQDPLQSVPGDYIVKSGDEIQLTIWGSVDADLRLTVDRAGRIAVPRVGAITVAGLRNADLNQAISRQVAQVFRNFQVSATLGQPRPIRVFAAGYARRPGSLTVSGLSSVLHVLMRAGGPSAAGSFRNISLRRAGREVAHFDLYDLLLKGDRGADQLVQPDDVVFIGPVGPQIGVIGSVNQPAVFELRAGETVADALAMAGGFNAVADRSRVTVERLADRLTGRVVEWSLPQNERQQLGSGDVLRAFSAITAALPKDKQKKRVRVEGEVARPGDYVLPPGSTIADALKAAGGLTPGAYLFGTDFSRESVRRAQQDNYDRALRDLETDMAKVQAGRRTTSAEEAANQTNVATANTRLLERLRQIRPTGRVVLQIQPDTAALPDLLLEDGDRLSIPSRATSIGVFGSVFNAGSFVYENGRTTQDYLQLAGGPTRGADKDSMFLVRANGSVVSAQQGASFWSSGNSFTSAPTVPGDTLFVPENLDKTTFTQNLKDWSQIFYQFGLGIAGIKALGL